MTELINYTKSTFGYVDILCNNAGVAGLENWIRTLDINLVCNVLDYYLNVLL